MNNNNANTWAQQHRQLRLFISSTFVDMDAERNALTRIFPENLARTYGRSVFLKAGLHTAPAAPCLQLLLQQLPKVKT